MCSVPCSSRGEAEEDQADAFECSVTDYYALRYVCSGERKARLGILLSPE